MIDTQRIQLCIIEVDNMYVTTSQAFPITRLIITLIFSY